MSVIREFLDSYDDYKSEILNDGKRIKDFYVYGWFNADWKCYFYIGKGKQDRYKEMRSRGGSFTAIVKNWECFPVILIDDLTEEEAWYMEDSLKQEFIFERGYPIMDGEGNSAALKNMAVQRAKAEKRKSDPDYKEGRPRLKINMGEFKNFLKKQKEGRITVAEAIKELGISRSTWYNLAKEA